MPPRTRFGQGESNGPVRDARAVRLVDLLDCLSESDERFTTKDLAERFGVATRTINRNLKTLEESGFRVQRDATTGAVSIDPSSFLTPLELTVEEVLSLLTLTGEFGHRDGLPGHRALEQAGAKLLDVLPAPLKRFFDESRREIGVEMPPRSQPERTGLAYGLFRDAVARRRCIDMDYVSIWDGARLRMTLEPYFLTFRRRAWYCVGYSRWHKEVRTFHLGRVSTPRMTDEEFDPDPDDSYFGNAWSMIREEPTCTVRLRFTELLSQNVADVRWHRSQQARWLDDRSVELTFTVDGLNEVSWWVLSYGDQVKVLEPEELQLLVIQRAQGMIEQYEPE